MTLQPAACVADARRVLANTDRGPVDAEQACADRAVLRAALRNMVEYAADLVAIVGVAAERTERPEPLVYPYCAFCATPMDDHPEPLCSPGVVRELRAELARLRGAAAGDRRGGERP